MKKSLLLLLMLILISQVFSQDPVQRFKGARPVIDVDAIPASAMEKGRISIKFKRSVESLLKLNPSKGADGYMRFNVPALDALNVQFKVSNSPKVFAQITKNGAFEERHKQWGFDLWYQLEFPANTDIKKLVAAYSKLAGVLDVVEPVYTIQRYKHVTDYKKPETPTPPSGNSVYFAPNDPRYSEQWHYNNTGQQGGTAGKDIKLQQAWDIVMGNPNVIVAVIDGGVDITHPDIIPNLWPGNGFNFVNNTSVLDADEHGTHTSGTVAAVSNNAVGVAGVAGGNGTAGTGVKLMSLEVFGPSSSASNFGAPFIWAADRGVTVAQNSWGYTSPNVYQQVVLDGIDYFVANGGGTALNGGIVIFASGNNNSEANFYPGYYDKTFAVAATNNRDVRANYSNYGAYVDISAPGGEQSFANDPKGVLSTTITTLNGGYEFLQGTSMACPHVSGVAAMIIARAPSRLSADDVKSILLSTTDNHYPDNAPALAGKLGVGRLNAYKAVLKAQDIDNSPVVNPVTGFTAALNCPNTQLNWTKNAGGDDVMIAYSTTGVFGIPSGSYNVGDAIPDGGIVAYKGSASSFVHAIPKDSAKVTYKIWSVTAANNYSLGLIKTVNTPFSLVTFTGNPVGANIQLNWTRKCPNSDVIVATNNASTFGVPTGVLNVGDNIPGGGRVIYKGPASGYLHTNPVAGANFYRIWPVGGTSGYSDFSISIAVCFGAVAGPISESFESATFPPAGWRIINNENDFTWQRSTRGAKTGVASARVEHYNYTTSGRLDYLLSPAMDITNADSVIFSFDRAYRYYGGSFSDTLEVVVSTDCGTTFTSVWKRGGSQLATLPGTFTGDYGPAAADWVNTRVDLKPFVGSSTNVIAGFRSKNGYGQNQYIDNVNLAAIENGRRDATIAQVVEPNGKLCARTLLPRVQIGNLGKDTLKTVKVMYRFNLGSTQGALDSVVWTGSLPIGGTAFVDLKNTNLASSGAYQFVVYTKEPNNQSDQINSNDTAKIALTVFDPQPDPVKESFEQATFPPANWSVVSAAGTYSWERTTRGANDKTASAWIRNFRHSTAGRKDDLYSPLVQVASPDSVYLKFDLAHATAKFPGSTATPLDTLEILLTTDCGKTLRSVYKKWGEDLATLDPNFPQTYAANDTVGFVPGGATHWRTEWVNVTRYITPNSKFQFVFRNTSNRGNNTYLDKIDISTVVLPARLKEKGYMITPNPFEGAFVIRHLLPPANLKGLQVMSSSGQIIVARQFNGNASNYITVDLSRYANGAYQVKLIYDNNVITERIIKRR